MKEKNRLDRIVGKVLGSTKKKGDFEFEISLKELKHIRRCLRYFQGIHPLDENSLGQKLINNFMLFGTLRGRGNMCAQRELMKKKRPFSCAISNCERKDLTIDHILEITNGGTSALSNLQWLCKKHHEIKNHNHRIDLKKRELQKLEEELKVMSNE